MASSRPLDFRSAAAACVGVTVGAALFRGCRSCGRSSGAAAAAAASCSRGDVRFEPAAGLPLLRRCETRRGSVGVSVGSERRSYSLLVVRDGRGSDAACAAIYASFGLPAPWEAAAGTEEARRRSLVGLDCEWERDSRVCTLQLSTHDTVVIFQLDSLHGGAAPRVLPPALAGDSGGDGAGGSRLAQLLADDRVYKAGAAVGGDAKKLARDYGYRVASWVCVQKLAGHFGMIAQPQPQPQPQPQEEANNKGTAEDEEEAGEGAAAAVAVPQLAGYSLQTLASGLCGVELDKDDPGVQAVRSGAWSDWVLSADQVRYAAHDAIASREVALSIRDLAERLAEAAAQGGGGGGGGWVEPEEDGLHHIGHLCEQHLNKRGGAASRAAAAAGVEEEDGEDGIRKASKKLKGRGGADDCRKKPLYSNCLILAPDSTPLVCTDRKKAMWYVGKDRAVVVEESPRLIIRLLFEPVGRNTTATVIENKCVVCGGEDRLLKHHVVPHCYRREFPRHRKVHQHHDVLLACKRCATVCQDHYTARRAGLEGEFAAQAADRHKPLRAAGSAMIAFLDAHRRATGDGAESAAAGDDGAATPVCYPKALLAEIEEAAAAAAAAATEVAEDAAAAEEGGDGKKTAAKGKKKTKLEKRKGIFLPKVRFDALSSQVHEFVRARKALLRAEAAGGGTEEEETEEEAAVLTLGELRALVEELKPLSVSKLVVDKMMDVHGPEDGITKLVEQWRQYFLDKMRPRHLPKNWSVDFKHVDAREMKAHPKTDAWRLHLGGLSNADEPDDVTGLRPVETL